MYVIYSYALQQAVTDGLLVEIFRNRWEELTGGKPLVATAHIYNSFSQAALREIWNEFAEWNYDIKATLPEADQLFSTTMNGQKVWVLEDGEAFTILFPEDY